MKKFLKLLSRHKTIVENTSYLSILEILILTIPLLSYPYLTRTVGMEKYGWILTSMMFVSYFSLIINFGTQEVCAKHISVNRDNLDKLSEIFSSVIVARFLLWVLSFCLYILILSCIPSYREYRTLFLLSYGLTLNELLFPSFYFQGVEKMKYITIISAALRLMSLVLIFLVVRKVGDYILVPICYSVGYLLAGIVSFYIILVKEGVRLYIPNFRTILFYIKDSFYIFSTDVISTIKDKFNYLLVGRFLGPESVVIYDLGSRLINIINKPISIIVRVLFPVFAKNRNITMLKTIKKYVYLLSFFSVLIVEIFLPYIVEFFLGSNVDIWPIRIYLLASLVLPVSIFIASNYFIALGYNQYIFKGILVTTILYVIVLVVLWLSGLLSNIYAFVTCAVISFYVEYLYRVIKVKEVEKNEIKMIYK